MISHWITSRLVSTSIIEERNRELYEYSIRSLLGNIMNIGAGIIIGVLCGEILRAIVFLAIMVPLRSSIGGCHLKSPLLCFIASCGIVLSCILLPDYLLVNQLMIIYFLVTLLFLFVISIIAPVDCIEKPMTEKEKKTLHTRVRMFNITIGLFWVIAFGMGCKFFCIEIFLAISYAMSTLIIELIRKRIRKQCM